MNNILKQVKLILKTYNLTPTRSKGQNFLISNEIIEKIIKVSEIKKDDVVLEVGSGLGILTEELIKNCNKVISVELDRKIFDFLKLKFVSNNNLTLINKDILRFKPEENKLLSQKYKIIANLPYNITSYFLRRFLTLDNSPSEMTLLLQKEVAERICAKKGEMSLLAVSVQVYGNPKIIEIVKRENFYPQPEVDSAILKIGNIKNKKQIKQFLEIKEDKFWRIVKIGFSAKRKQLQNNLAAGLKISSDEAKNVLKKANFNPKIRAQELSIKDWIKLAKYFNL